MDTVGKYETAIREYIDNQLKDDMMNDQMTLKEYIDPFTGSKKARNSRQIKKPPGRGLPEIKV